MNTASGCKPPTAVLEQPLTVLTEVVSNHEAAYRYVEVEGEFFLSARDIVGSLLELGDRLEGLGGVHEEIANALNQIAVQIATPFMEMGGEKAASLHILPGGGLADR